MRWFADADWRRFNYLLAEGLRSITLNCSLNDVESLLNGRLLRTCDMREGVEYGLVGARCIMKEWLHIWDECRGYILG